MNNVTKKFDIDLYSPTIYEIIQAQQGDNNSRIIEFVLYNQGKPYTISNNISVKMEGHRGDNSSFQPKNCTVSGNVISCILDSDILYEAGTVEAKIVMYDLSSDTILSTIPFKISVQKNPYDKNKIEKEKKSLIDWLIQNIEKIKTGLDKKADIESPTLTGTPKAPTASAGTNNTQIATTAFTQTAVNNHNTSSTAHSDIRNLISALTTRLNALADSDDTTLDQLSEIVAYIKSNRTLIETVTTNKVNVSDVIDNLTSTATNKPLSANQGKILKELIDDITTKLNNSHEVNVQSDWKVTDKESDAYIKNKPIACVQYNVNSPGWYRIAYHQYTTSGSHNGYEQDPNLSCKIFIKRSYANYQPEVHSLYLKSVGTVDFIRILSGGNARVVTKLRLVYNKVTGRHYLDFYYNAEKFNWVQFNISDNSGLNNSEIWSVYDEPQFVTETDSILLKEIDISKEFSVNYKSGRHLTLDGGTFKLSDFCALITDDWNDADKNGWYMAANVANAPAAGWLYGIVIAHNASYVRQILYRFGVTNDISNPICDRFERVKNNGTWGEWVNTSVRKSVPSDAVFTDSKVRQTPYDMSDTTHYELNVLFSKSKNNSEKTEETYIAEGFTYSPYMGSLNVHRIIADYFTQWDYKFSDKMKIGTSAMSFSDIKKTIVCVDGNAHSKVGKYLDFIGDNGDSVSVNSNITFAVGTNDDHANDTFLYIQMPTRSTGNSTGFVFRKNTDPAIDSSSFYSDPIIKTNGSITRPYLGMTGTPWNSLFTVTSPIITSDRNKKHDISYLCDNKDGIGDKFERLFLKLKAAIFRYNENTSNRLHMGGISQDVEAAMQELGIDSTEFAGFCKDVRYTYTEFDENGMGLEDSKVAETDADGNILYDYSLRYEEFIFLCIHMVQKLWDKNKSLEEKVSVLEEENDAKIKQLEKRIEDLEKLIASK